MGFRILGFRAGGAATLQLGLYGTTTSLGPIGHSRGHHLASGSGRIRKVPILRKRHSFTHGDVCH